MNTDRDWPCRFNKVSSRISQENLGLNWKWHAASRESTWLLFNRNGVGLAWNQCQSGSNQCYGLDTRVALKAKSMQTHPVKFEVRKLSNAVRCQNRCGSREGCRPLIDLCADREGC